MPLQVRIGTDTSTLKLAEVNDEENPTFIQSNTFQGSVLVRIKDFAGVSPSGLHKQCKSYFAGKGRKFSIQLSCRFLDNPLAKDVVFGAQFENKIHPPMGTSIGLRLANLIDPGLQADLYSARPWLLSPLFCAMNTMQVLKIGTTHPIPSVVQAAGTPKSVHSPHTPVLDYPPDPDTKFWPWKDGHQLIEHCTSISPTLKTAWQRKSYFKHKNHLETFKLDSSSVYNMEFFGPAIDFNTFKLSLGINVDIRERVCSQPIRFVCKNKTTDQTYFVVEFDLLD